MSAFRLDIFSAAGAKLNTITQISGVGITSRVNRLGELRFTVPQLVALDRGIGRGRVYKLYHYVDGLLGTFYHLSNELSEDGDLLSVTCYDQLYELTRKTVGFNWAFSGLTFVQDMNAIMSRYGNGWAATTDHSSSDFYDFTYDTAGESYFQLIEQARRSNAGWFALSGDKQIKYGRWLDSRLTGSIAARFISVASAAGWRIAANGDIAIERMTVREDSSTIINRVIGLGQGLGVAQLTLKYSDLTSPYPVLTRGNWDGSNTNGTNDAGAKTREYYIEDSSSIAEHGLNEATVQFDVKPITNSKADLLNAGNALYSAAVAYLLRSRKPLVNYTLSVLGLPNSVSCGSVVEVDYRDVATVIDANNASVRKVKLALNKVRLFVSEISREFDDIGGLARATLTVSTTGETFAEQTEVTTELIRDAKRFKLRPAPSMALREKSFHTQAIKNGVNYVCKLKYDAAVLELNAVKFVFRLGPLVSYASNNTASGGGATTSSGGGQAATTTSAAGGGTQTTSGVGGGGTSGVGSWSSGVVPTVTGFGYPKTGGIEATTSIYNGLPGFYNHSHFSDPSGHQHSLPDMNHSHPVPVHSHSVNLNDHSHGVSITIASHTHSVSDHTHAIVFGVIEDSVTPSGVSIWLNGVQVTQIKNYDTGQFAGNTVSGAGTYYVSLITALQNMSDWRGNHDIEIKCTGGQGLITGKTEERLTIQPIAVAGDD